MTRMFAGAYLVTHGRQSLADDPTAIVSGFYDAMGKHEFPFDLGDDPAFFSARYHDGPVTWGVCRPDVRRSIQTGEWMVFFAAEKEDRYSALTRYRFSAALRVERKISHEAIFTHPSEFLFRGYLNLLIRRRGRDGWEHFEPCLRKRDWHTDWLWRISDPIRKRFHKRDFVAAGDRHHRGDSLSVNGRPAPIADSYVIFSMKDSIVAHDPPHVATHKKGNPRETWKPDRRSQLIRELVFGDHPRRCLRTSNRQQPHRHVQRHFDDSTWAKKLRKAIRLT